MKFTGWNVHTCDVCGKQFRYRNVQWEDPAWPHMMHGDIYDAETDRAQRVHAATHGGSLDRQFAYTGPTTWTVTAEPEDVAGVA